MKDHGTNIILVKGRAAFITCGAGGIGLGIARALLANSARVVIADVDPGALTSALADLDRPDAAIGVMLDVRDRDQWRTARDLAEARFGPITIFVNNAGVIGYDAIIDTPPDNFDWVVGVNLTGTFNGVHCFGRAMVDRGLGGHIVHTASIVGLYGSNSLTVGAYAAASKHAIVGLSDRLRAELGDQGVGISVLCPGMVTTAIRTNAAKLRPVAATQEGAANPGLSRLRAAPPAARLDPYTLGVFVVRAIENNRAYIIPHPHFGQLVQARHQAIMDDFGEPADPYLPIPPDWRDFA